MLVTFDTEFKICKQASCDVCINIRVITGDLVVCVSSDQTAGFVSCLNLFQKGKILVQLPVSLYDVLSDGPQILFSLK